MHELIEIQTGVSEKEISVEEAERLYRAWNERMRWRCLSKIAIKGLEEMRNTYASVITQAKSRGERRSLFDMIKDKMGGRKSSNEEENIHQPNILVLFLMISYKQSLFKQSTLYKMLLISVYKFVIFREFKNRESIHVILTFTQHTNFERVTDWSHNRTSTLSSCSN